MSIRGLGLVTPPAALAADASLPEIIETFGLLLLLWLFVTSVAMLALFFRRFLRRSLG